ncbi:uncharacterized protein [Ptychodera flava]|uniref:uncharacterized protein n=1 Tax=Ptychodera flava TaxID=63121 RepID=UPI00396A59AE
MAKLSTKGVSYDKPENFGKTESPKTLFQPYESKQAVCNRWTVLGIVLVTVIMAVILYLNSVEFDEPVQMHGNLVVLPKELASEKGAYCLDGSPPGYYFRKGKDNAKNSWIVFLQGGGWCYNISDCYNRSFYALGSSDKFPKQFLFDGFVSSDKTVSPDFYNWNVAYLAYCDGASFAGNAEDAVTYKGRKIYFRGKRVLDLLLDHLLEHGLSKADRVILSGVSAGGLAVYIHADYIRNKIPPATDFHAFADAGYFPDVRNITNFHHIRLAYQKIYNFQEVQGGLNKECMAAHELDEQWKCFFPQYTYKYIKTPMFALNSAFDYWTMWFILDLRCYYLKCDDTGKHFYAFYPMEFITLAQQLFNSTKDGVYISSCFAHSQAARVTEWTNYLVNGTTPQKAFSDWYFGRKSVQGSKYHDCTTPACNPTCDWSYEYYKNVSARLSSFDFTD